mgnify:CR=1 FL=1
MFNNLLKAFPYLLVILPIIGFFVNTNTPQWQAHNPIQELLLFLIILPWWGKILSIIIGFLWIIVSNFNEETKP